MALIFLINRKTKLNFNTNIAGINYSISEYPDSDEAGAMLAELNEYLSAVIKRLRIELRHGNVGADYEYFVDNIINRYDPTVIAENPPVNGDTAYIINKNKEFKICLRDRQSGELIRDMPLLKFVVLHELTHIGCFGADHDYEFWNNFRWLLQTLTRCGMYKPEDYKKSPKRYCGLTVSDNPYYDFNPEIIKKAGAKK